MVLEDHSDTEIIIVIGSCACQKAQLLAMIWEELFSAAVLSITIKQKSLQITRTTTRC